ncbi:hypothetical protein J2W46_002758 [Paraburkholderia strydomiana]|nr:hypothetical protein [Paraburkholderia strydomiana]
MGESHKGMKLAQTFRPNECNGTVSRLTVLATRKNPPPFAQQGFQAQRLLALTL